MFIWNRFSIFAKNKSHNRHIKYMEEKFGLVTGVECKYVKTDPDLIESIVARTGIPFQKVKSMMRYNIFTIGQFAELSQLAVSSILNKTRPSVVDKETGALGTELDYTYPFQSAKMDGPKFILRNQKSEKYLKG